MTLRQVSSRLCRTTSCTEDIFQVKFFEVQPIPQFGRPGPLLLTALVLVGIASISTASILIRLADAPSLAIATYRVTLASLFISPVFCKRFESGRSRCTPRVLGLTAASGIFLALHFAFWIHSLGLTSVASSATLVGTTPLFVALFSLLVLSEPTNARLWVGILCTIVGGGFIAGTDFSFSRQALLGDGLALLGALMAAGYLLTGRAARQDLDLCTYIFGTYSTAALTLLLCCLLTGTPLLGFSRQTFLALVLLAIVPQLIGHTTFNWTLKFLSSATVAVLILGEPIGATLLAYVILGETVSVPKAVGLVVLGMGILLSSIAAPAGPGGQPCPPAQSPNAPPRA